MASMTRQRPILISCAGGGFAGEIAALLTGFEATDRLVFAYPRTEARWLQRRMQARHFFVMQNVAYGMRAGRNKKLPLFWILAVRRCIRKVKNISPELAIFVGSSECLPLILACRILHIRCIYIESITRVEDLSMTGRIVYHGRLANIFLVQWPCLLPSYPRAQYQGVVYDLRYCRNDVF
jgi:beta-1,4-N-acetylglucosaminyltransferase